MPKSGLSPNLSYRKTFLVRSPKGRLGDLVSIQSTIEALLGHTWQVHQDDLSTMLYSYGCKATVRFTKSFVTFSKRTFASTSPVAAAQLPPHPKIKEADIEEAFLKGSGPGGQKIVRLSTVENSISCRLLTSLPTRTKPPQPYN